MEGCRSVPVITLPGGLGAHVDAMRFLDHVEQREYPAAALATAVFLASGVRGMERGTMSEARDVNTGVEPLAHMELVRLALPRRVFTLSQVNYAIDRIDWRYQNRRLIGGMRWVEEPDPALLLRTPRAHRRLDHQARRAVPRGLRRQPLTPCRGSARAVRQWAVHGRIPMLHRSPVTTGHRTLTFSLPLEWAGRVSVVGNFNDWTPGRHTLVASGDVATASVELPSEYIAVFRYLGDGDHWFDEPEADFVDAGGSVVLAAAEASEPAEWRDGRPAVAPEPGPSAPLSPAQKAKTVGRKRKEREEEKAREAAEKTRRKRKKLADKITKAAQKQRKAAERVAREREKAARKAAKKG